jgi:hypothetical protein
MAQIHQSNDLVGATTNGNGHTFVAKTTGPHTISVGTQTSPANGKLGFTGQIQLQTSAGVVVHQSNGASGGTVPLVAGTTYKWVIVSGTPIGNVAVSVNDAT